jgi:membrane-bound metal-dependent hydrolase YbcI (DUF457 family)
MSKSAQWPPAAAPRRSLLAAGTLSIVGWLATAGALYLMFALALPSVLTLAFVGAMTTVVLLSRGPVVRGLTVSIAVAAITVLIALVYRAGPTSGWQLPNALLGGLAGVTLLVSLVDLARLRRVG